MKKFALVTGAALLALLPLQAEAQVPGPPVKTTPESTKVQAPKGPPPAEHEDAAASYGPSKAVIARVQAATKRAAAMSKYGDWLSAANELEQAYLLLRDPELAYQVAEAAHKAKDCGRAEAYYAAFLDYPELGQPEAMILAARKGANELATFECPARTTDDVAALAETFARDGKVLGTEGDWLGALLEYVRAYELAPGRQELAYEVAVAAWNAHECSDSVSYFYHFLEVADPRKYRSQLKQSSQYIDDSEAGKCKPWDSDDAGARARELYAQGQALEFELDHLAAVAKYQRAKLLVPENFTLNFRIAESLWTAHRCAEAEPYYREFTAQATESRYDRDRGKSEDIIARIEASGCPAALRSNLKKPVSSSSDGSGSGSGDMPQGSDEGPPPIPVSSSSTGCAVTGDTRGRGAHLMLALLALLGVRRRRAHKCG